MIITAIGALGSSASSGALSHETAGMSSLDDNPLSWSSPSERGVRSVGSCLQKERRKAYRKVLADFEDEPSLFDLTKKRLQALPKDAGHKVSIIHASLTGCRSESILVGESTCQSSCSSLKLCRASRTPLRLLGRSRNLKAGACAQKCGRSRSAPTGEVRWQVREVLSSKSPKAGLERNSRGAAATPPQQPHVQGLMPTSQASTDEPTDETLALSNVAQETGDSIQDLKDRTVALTAVLQTLADVGAARHASVVRAQREKAVALRKIQLLELLVKHQANFQDVLRRKEDVISRALRESSGREALQKAIDFRCFFSAVTQANCKDLTRGNFHFNVRNMGLPQHHHMVLKARQVLKQGTEELADAATQKLQQLQALPHTNQLALPKAAEQVADVLLELGLPAGHSCMDSLLQWTRKTKVESLLGFARKVKSLSQALADGAGGAEAALKSAFKIKAAYDEALRLGVREDLQELAEVRALMYNLRATAALRGVEKLKTKLEEDQSGMTEASFSSAVSTLRAEISECLKFGVPADERVLCEAGDLLDGLQAREVLELAQHLQMEDARLVELGQFRSGGAAAAADLIDAGAQVAETLGLRADHPVLLEAMSISRSLREQETLRRLQRYAEASRRRMGQ